MKKLFLILISIIVSPLFTGCSTTPFTWDWPKEGTVIERKIEPPSFNWVYINGQRTKVWVNEQPIYWLRIQHGDKKTWVHASSETDWINATEGKTWKRS